MGFWGHFPHLYVYMLKLIFVFPVIINIKHIDIMYLFAVIHMNKSGAETGNRAETNNNFLIIH